MPTSPSCMYVSYLSCVHAASHMGYCNCLGCLELVSVQLLLCSKQTNKQTKEKRRRKKNIQDKVTKVAGGQPSAKIMQNW